MRRSEFHAQTDNVLISDPLQYPPVVAEKNRLEPKLADVRTGSRVAYFVVFIRELVSSTEQCTEGAVETHDDELEN